MRQIDVALGERSYPVVIGNGLIDRCRRAARAVRRGNGWIVSSPTKMSGACSAAALSKAIIDAANIDVAPITVSPGEGSKSWATLSRLIDALSSFGVERGDYLVALGGGVVGDLAGFAAAILKRGCCYVQIPTTLLAQVDASVGGKTAINVAAGKNLVGRLPPAARGADRSDDTRHPARPGASRRLCRGRQIRADRRCRFLRLVRGATARR